MKENGFVKGAMIAALIAGYTFASHFALILPEGKKIAAALALGVPAVISTVFIFKWMGKLVSNHLAGSRFFWVSILASTLAVLPVVFGLWFIWPLVVENAAILYFVQHVGTNALLAWVFGHTLIAGSTPLIVSLARILDPALPVEMEAYARKVTLAWTLFFVATCVVSVILFLITPLPVWSTFAVLLQWPTVLIFFVGEYLLRRHLFKQFEHASLKAGFDAYRNHQAGTDTSSAFLSKTDL